ncbi:MAG: S8/S53 family peptidase, partial [Chloroflexi bacterium]|nr:S8/S53 family peptidase [Chloroflexota bacterium]
GGFGAGRTGGAGETPIRLGPTADGTLIDFSLVLRQPDPGAIEAYLADLSDPGSPDYRRFLTAPQYGERFGLALDRIAGVEAWAQQQGLTVVGRHAQRTTVRLQAPAGTVNRVFGVTLMDEYDPATGHAYVTLDAAPGVPSAISPDVDAVAGLDDRPVWSFSAAPSGFTPASVPRTGLGPADLAAAYDIAPLYEAGVFGAGQYIAIISFDTYLPSDIATFEQQLGIVDAPPIERIAVGEPLTAPGSDSNEVTLDIDVIRSVAPQARILNFEAPNNGSVGFAEMVDAIVEDGRASIISVSWGLCDTDDRLSPISRLSGERAFQAMAAAGISLFAASGDWGAYTCSVRDPSDHRVTVFWPSSSPHVVSVGGTHLSVRADGSYLDEAGWEDYLSTGGTGGGLNPVAERPEWQRGVGVDNDESDGRRQLPDISAAADPDTGYAVYYTVEGGGWSIVGGTSGAAPFWAGITALFGEVNERAGVGEIGFINPLLYAIAESAPPDTVFHDVVRGGDLLHRARPGWDYATGLGTPDVTA